ncbi:hypothetical protein AOLI_G00113200 [Acnodon oligacanthus]
MTGLDWQLSAEGSGCRLGSAQVLSVLTERDLLAETRLSLQSRYVNGSRSQTPLLLQRKQQLNRETEQCRTSST